MKTTDHHRMGSSREPVAHRGACLALAIALSVLFATPRTVADDEAFIVTPPGFTKPGQAKTAMGEKTSRLRITVRDRATGRPTPCRLNVVGPDGNFYQPATNPLSPYSLNGQWPGTGKGNREGKAPIRYLGRFFYTTGTVEVIVPSGTVRLEAWKGFEYRPVAKCLETAIGQTIPVDLVLDRTIAMTPLGYRSGDSHLHFPRKTEADDRVILDLLEAEDIHYGSILAYNEPAGPYTGVMEKMDAPQLRGLGKASVVRRGDTAIASGQEYRSSSYGHLNLFWRDDLVLNGQKVDANNWPLYGALGRETKKRGGFAIHAHGGYAQAIYADFVQKNVDAVELLQFGVYRGIALADWYQILNIGYRFPCVGASDYPACRKLGDCRTYADISPRGRGTSGGRGSVRASSRAGSDGASPSPEGDFAAWLKAASEGRSFVTSGPLLLLEVDEERPGGIIRKTGPGSHRVKVSVRATCEVAPIQTVQLIVNGKVVHELAVPAEQGRGVWIDREHALDLDRPSWIAARAYSKAPSGAPDAEAHTNPVYVYVNDKAPYDQDALDHLVTRIDKQIAVHRQRSFDEKARVLDYFQKSRDILLRIRREGGLPASGVPDAWVADAAESIDASRRTLSDDQLKQFLQAEPSVTPLGALKTFETVDGFRMELVAAEPIVQSPVAAAFDADGNLYVAEMRDYPYRPKPGNTPLGTVRLLRDTDGDGRFDRSTVFAGGLLWAAGIAPWKGGVFVTAPPDIWYLKDTDGDDRADVRTKVYTGFGTQNQQAMVNNLAWGLDHFIYGASSGNGGMIRTGAPHSEMSREALSQRTPPRPPFVRGGQETDRSAGSSPPYEGGATPPGVGGGSSHRSSGVLSATVKRSVADPKAPGVSVEHSDFRFEPMSGAFELVSGNNQFGNTFDDWGNRFTCNESHPLSQPVLPRRELARNPYLAVPSAVRDIAGGSVPIFRISPVERWRQIRSSRRVAYSERPTGSAGVSHHVVDAGAGATIYRGGAYPAEFYGNVFVGDAQNNLIHRRILVPDGPTFQAVRGPREQATEFVRSADNWFRPVNFVNAPDGTLYALDMSRAVIEAIHIPLDVVKHLDLKRGRDQGRYHRIAPPGFRYAPPPRLSQATTIELVAALARPDAWYRDTAHRLIYERQDPAAIEPLRKLLSPAGAAFPPARVNALWSLEGLKALGDEDLATALSDPVPEVRAQAVVLAALRLDRSRALLERALELAKDVDARVRFRVALALGETTDSRAVIALAGIARRDAANPWIRTAVLSSCASTADRLFMEIWTGQTPPASDVQELLKPLVEIVGARNRPEEIGRVLDVLAGERIAPSLAIRDRLVLTLARGVRRSGGRIPIDPKSARPGAAMVARSFQHARALTHDAHTPEAALLTAIDILSTLDPDGSRADLQEWLAPQQPLSVQVTVVRAMAEGGSANLPDILLPRLRTFEPTVRAAAIRTLLSRTDWTRALLRTLQPGAAGGISPSLIEPSDRTPLVKHRDPEIARLAQALFGQSAAGSRAPIIADYAAILRTKGDPSRGAKVFDRDCKACHQIGKSGFALGPDLTGSPSSDPAALLANILDPNASVQPAYLQYTLIDQSGRTYSGIIASETATSLTLRRGDGAEDTILRAQLDEMASTGLSMMPEGIEKTISKPEMADLIAFLRAAHRGGPAEGADDDRTRPLDIGTLPGLIEPDE